MALDEPIDALSYQRMKEKKRCQHLWIDSFHYDQAEQRKSKLDRERNRPAGPTDGPPANKPDRAHETERSSGHTLKEKENSCDRTFHLSVSSSAKEKNFLSNSLFLIHKSTK